MEKFDVWMVNGDDDGHGRQKTSVMRTILFLTSESNESIVWKQALTQTCDNFSPQSCTGRWFMKSPEQFWASWSGLSLHDYVRKTSKRPCHVIFWFASHKSWFTILIDKSDHKIQYVTKQSRKPTSQQKRYNTQTDNKFNNNHVFNCRNPIRTHRRPSVPCWIRRGQYGFQLHRSHARWNQYCTDIQTPGDVISCWSKISIYQRPRIRRSVYGCPRRLPKQKLHPNHSATIQKGNHRRHL